MGTGGTTMKELVKRLALEEQVYVDDTWNWFEHGQKSEYVLVELEHCLTLEVPSVHLHYCRDEADLARQFVHHHFTYGLSGRRTFFVLVGERKAEIGKLIS
jgi:hypothetical protein